ncbi:MAG: hypothetical protein IT406_02860 [Candidatus Yanofskybacteria bacterium]|nr:hypothetical protein [Candidatus Yanofskybacteria bacterium]
MRLLLASVCVLLCSAVAYAQEAINLTDQIEVVDILPTRSVSIQSPGSITHPPAPVAPRVPIRLSLGVGGEAADVRNPFSYLSAPLRPIATLGVADICASLLCLRVEQAMNTSNSWRRSSAELRVRLIGHHRTLNIFATGDRTAWDSTTFEGVGASVGVRRATSSFGAGFEYSLNALAHTAPRIGMLYGYSDSRHDSWLRFDSNRIIEPLSRSSTSLLGIRLGSGATVARRLEIIGEGTYAIPLEQRRVIRPQSTWSARGVVRLRIKSHLGAFVIARIADERSELALDRSASIGLLWMK